jgi:hypothetical protein
MYVKITEDAAVKTQGEDGGIDQRIELVSKRRF